jgi:hypothetical protein
LGKVKAKTDQVVPIPRPRTNQRQGKPVAPPVASQDKQKFNVKSAIIAFAVFSTAIIIWQWDRAPVITPAGVQTTSGIETAPAGATVPAGETSTAAVAAARSTAGAAGSAGSSLIIAAIRVTPTQPLATDPITAVVSLAGGYAPGITFSYQWKCNDRLIPAATANVLKDIPLKRRDRISVVATAFRDGVTGPSLESQPVVIYSLPPSLGMEILTPQIRMGLPIAIQLTGVAPDGDKIVYSLISPFLEGMAIDTNTGKISWTPARVLKEKLKFGAAATDTDGNKTMKVFELDMGLEPGP